MAIKIVDNGSNNTLSVSPDTNEQLQGRILIHGNDNLVEIGPGCVSNHIHIEIDSGCTVRIGSACVLGNLFVYIQQSGSVTIGDHTGFNGLVRLLVHEPGKILIGKQCLFAGEIDVTVSDMHSIIDVATGNRINPARDVIIDDHVWVGQRAMLLKGTNIGAGSMIGACSLVSGKLPSQVLAAGVPARILRTGVTWRHELTA